MRIVDVEQGSEQWDEIRRGVPTASNFNRIVTPVKGQLSASCKSYMVELIAQELKVSVPPSPSFWMDWGTEHEKYAVKAYEIVRGLKEGELRKVGFVWPDDHEWYGCSPDRLVGEDGLLETKCPKPETVIEYHVNNVLPNDYKPQVMGQLLITDRKWCDFMAYHPDLAPFLIRVERDEEYIETLRESLREFCERLEALKDDLITVVDIGDPVPIPVEEYQPEHYETSEIDL